MVGRYRKHTGHKRYEILVFAFEIFVQGQEKMQMAEIFKWISHKDEEDTNPAKVAQERRPVVAFCGQGDKNRGAP